MWRLSIVLVAALLWPAQAEAAPVVGAITTFAGWFANAGFWAKFAIQLGASFILNAFAAAIARRRTPDQKRELQLPTSRPPKRFVYGRNRVYGTPAPWRVKGTRLYGCLILNSRPSAGGDISILMDKRACTVTTGDIFNFAGNGAILGTIEDFLSFGGSNLGNPRIWIGLGDQTAPPAVFTTEAPEFFQASDGWRGCTVAWVRLDAGPNKQRAKRWRAAPPEFEFEMDWSLVYDPRDDTHDPDDPDTWAFSRNQSLALLDALRENPIRRYPFSQIHLASFIEGANVADEQVKLHYASIAAAEDVFEARYEANGIVIWTANELLDQITPLAEAGGGSLVRIGGRVGYAPGEYRPPLLTVRDFVEDGGIDYQVLRPGRDLPTMVMAVYIAPERDWQEADLAPVPVEGADDISVGESGMLELGLDFVTSATQAMRLQQIKARQLAAQRTLAITLWPEAMDVVGGATIETDLAGGFQRLNGEWMVKSANPALWLSEIEEDGDAKLALRIPVTLEQTSAYIYEWVPAVDEQEVLTVTFDPQRASLEPPDNLTATSGAGISTQESPRIRVDFDAVDGADFYEIERRIAGGVDAYTLATATESNQNNVLFADVSTTYDIRVRAVATSVDGRTRFSEFAEILGVQAVVADVTLPIPTNGIAVGGAGEIAVSFTAPNSAFYTGTQFWGSNTNSIGAASLLTTLFGAAGENKTFTETGLGAGATRYYFARAVGQADRASVFTASVSATTDP